MDSDLLSIGRQHCIPKILRIVIQSLVAFVPQGKSLKRSLMFALSAWGFLEDCLFLAVTVT